VPPYRRDIGMVFQYYAIWPHLNVFENVAFPLPRTKEFVTSGVGRLDSASLAAINLLAASRRRHKMKHTAAMLLLLSVGWFTSPLLPTRNTVE
jgi:ABC-type Fe3+/spermidine/putrescine transport system ATPase subunit